MATRFYLPSSGAAAVNPATSAQWDNTITGWARRRCVLAKTNSGGLDLTWSGATALGADILFAQYVSDPLSGPGTISGSVAISIRSLESNPLANAILDLGVKVVSNDGLTVRGTLVAASGGAEFPTSAASRYVPKSIASCNFEDGDRVVIEIGAKKASTDDYTLTLQVRDDAAGDLDAADGDTDLESPWVEFFANLPFAVAINPAALELSLSLPSPAVFISYPVRGDLRLFELDRSRRGFSIDTNMRHFELDTERRIFNVR